jgi:catechol 2,3-dioxygenase-like lactoylglutathione lyase family enzyme
MAVARTPTLVLDAPDAQALASFYAELLGWRVMPREDEDWATIRGPQPHEILDFQQVEGDYTPPTWPDQRVPQQMHLDVVVDDLDEAEAATLALGATKAEHQPGETFRVFLDPAGHPFCLCLG